MVQIVNIVGGLIGRRSKILFHSHIRVPSFTLPSPALHKRESESVAGNSAHQP